MRQNSSHARDVAVCILFYEKVEQTIHCIDSFIPAGVPIYVLNNGSTPDTRQALGWYCENFQQVTILDSDRNLGVSGGRNRLLQHTREPWLFFVDNDITVGTPNWLEILQETRAQNGACEAFVPTTIDVHYKMDKPFRRLVIEGKNVAIVNADSDATLNVFPGGASIVSRQVFERLGLYDEAMFVGFEDWELAVRGLLREMPIAALAMPDVVLHHTHAVALGEADQRAVRVRYDTRAIRASAARLEQKHGVRCRFGRDWEQWVEKEVTAMLAGRPGGEGVPPPARPTAGRLLGRVLAGNVIRRGARFVRRHWRLERERAVERFNRRVRCFSEPSHCTVFMTDRCNLKCRGCRRSTVGVPRSAEMTLETVQRVLALYPRLRSFTIAGFGEPTLSPHFVEIVDHLSADGRHVGIITNGLAPGRISALAYAPRFVSISLQGHDNEAYERNTGVRAFDTVMRTFERARARFRKVGFSFIVRKSALDDLDSVLRLTDDLQPDFFHLLNYLVYDPADADEQARILTTADTDVIERIEHVCTGRDYIKLRPVYIDRDRCPRACRSYFTVLNVDGDGNIGGCQRQVPPSPEFGNIFASEDPFNSSPMRLMRRRVRRGRDAHEQCCCCFGNWIE